MALEKLSVSPEKSVAVEDSRTGLTAAKNAGLKAVFTNEFADENHSHLADITISSLGELLKL
jgi:beta-phosphoglucomutase-like phosphatase (HAD superfamily)